MDPDPPKSDADPQPKFRDLPEKDVLELGLLLIDAFHGEALVIFGFLGCGFGRRRRGGITPIVLLSGARV